jgi:hypothetical protein
MMQGQILGSYRNDYREIMETGTRKALNKRM